MGQGKITGMVLLLLLAMNIGMAKPMVTEDSLAHGRIAAWPGSMAEKYVKERMPGAKMVYLDAVADMVQNLRQNKVDAFAMNRLFIDEAMGNGQSGFEILGDSLGKTSFSFAFTPGDKGEQLCREFNEFLEECRENGKLAMLQEKWLHGSKADRVPEEFHLSGENGTLSVVMNPLF
ncbi:MAG: transporter substrate-binding domain-containing protein, partial [Selenomonadaceae bacterium]|nr:transporter substrate-binding domain-containing protein [Selenomonadaceae bacterium]